ncbi:SpoIID/LytB domain-containing protein [uncultured Selenomonas sp.]|uniref:SpoIID/LytB domain-containing protein n=1 Tax=uncultured Selenomonas sp. TaxID=159275 RepID=UPI0028E31790|nr:SpoIID/LytB domain-containing protein [uncultured Selenomonas sp.]
MKRCLWLCCSFLFVVIAVLPMQVFASWQPEITVGLSQGVSEVRIAATTGSLHVYEDPDKKQLLEVPPGKELDIRILQTQFLVNGQKIKGDRLVIQPDDTGFVKVNGASYRGYITLLKKNGFTIINNVQVEDYLYGVVPKEMPPNWPVEALQAQSVAARTFALKNRKRHSTEGFDLCSTSHCQVYEGMAAETRTTTDAVNHTRGEVLFYKGNVIDALFHTDSGGMTESSENMWGSSVPYLHAVTEVQMQTQPWSRTVSVESFVRSVEQDGRSLLGTLKEIRLSPLTVGKGSGDRTPSGRVRSAEFVGTKGRVVLSGNELRSMFSLPSTLFSVRFDRAEVVISGYGSGHGLGLSQWGAKAFADKAKSYKEILFHYYTGVTLEKLY